MISIRHFFGILMMKKIRFLILLFGLGLAACVPAAAEGPVTPAGENPTSTIQPAAESPTASGDWLPDETARAAMYDLIDSLTQKQTVARELVLASGDPRFIPVFIELLRAGQLGLGDPGNVLCQPLRQLLYSTWVRHCPSGDD